MVQKKKAKKVVSKYKGGDIFLTDSDASYAKIVKFLMQAPTIWHWLWRAITRTQQPVRYYHAGMLVDGERVIEQQKVVEYETVYDAFEKKDRYIVLRYTKLTAPKRKKLIKEAEEDLGQKYDILLIFGKTLTWLTGIKWFVRHMEAQNKDICVTRVANWYKDAIGYTFGQATPHEVTTDIIDDYCCNNSEEWDIVDIKI